MGTDLLSGAANSQTMTLVAKIIGTGAFSTTASIVEPATVYDHVSANNVSIAGGSASKATDVVVTSLLSEGPYYPSENYTIVIEAANLGPDNATMVKIAHELSGLKQVYATPSAGTTYDVTNRTWTITELATGAANKASLTLVVSPLEYGLFSNSAYKTGGNEFDPNGGNNASGNNSTFIYGQAEEKPSLLPVTLTTFTGKVQAQGIALYWATASEQNSAYFEVQRSTDGKNFSTIGQVASAGNSSQLLNYQFLDKEAPAGVVYYRLHQVDLDGAFEDSKVIAVQQKARQTVSVKINVFPNPSASNPTLNLSSLPTEAFMVTLYNMKGQQVQQINVKGGTAHTLEVQQLAMGQYIIQVSNGTFFQTLKFIKK